MTHPTLPNPAITSLRPLPAGSEIDFCGHRGIVIRDDGGHRIKVDCDGIEQDWFWTFEGVECTVVRRA